MTKIEAFYERQNEFNKRLEQRVSEHLTKEREDSRAPRNKRLPKELSVSHLAHKNLQVLILFISSLGTLLQHDFFTNHLVEMSADVSFFPILRPST